MQAFLVAPMGLRHDTLLRPAANAAGHCISPRRGCQPLNNNRLRMDYAAKFDRGLSYADFLARYGSDEHRRRWGAVHAQVKLTAAQRELLAGFRREMKVLCLAGAWCGDCVNQCPIFDHFAAATPKVQVRYLDRDDHADLAAALRICGGARVPVVVFLSEDGQLCGLYGDRTLAKYRQLAVQQVGAHVGGSCPTGISPDTQLLEAVTQDWLNELERVHWMLRVSPRLRQLHGD